MFQTVWNGTAEKNTQVYEKVFRCIPTNSVHTFSELKHYENEAPLSQTDSTAALISLQEIQGTLVKFPLEFLKDEELNPPIMSKQGIIPYEIFT